MKNIRIRSFSGPYSVQMWENKDQQKSEYGQFLLSFTYPLRSLTQGTHPEYLLTFCVEFLFMFYMFLSIGILQMNQKNLKCLLATVTSISSFLE